MRSASAFLVFSLKRLIVGMCSRNQISVAQLSQPRRPGAWVAPAASAPGRYAWSTAGTPDVDDGPRSYVLRLGTLLRSRNRNTGLAPIPGASRPGRLCRPWGTNESAFDRVGRAHGNARAVARRCGVRSFPRPARRAVAPVVGVGVAQRFFRKLSCTRRASRKSRIASFFIAVRSARSDTGIVSMAR